MSLLSEPVSRPAMCFAAAVLALAGCSDEAERDSAATETAENPQTVVDATTTSESGAPAPPTWPGPVNDRVAVVHRMVTTPDTGQGGSSWDAPLGPTWHDPLDASLRSVDIDRVYVQPGGFPGWSIRLAARPPLAADAEPGLVIAYGLVFDKNGDGAADHLVGIDDGAPRQGGFRVWVTDLATGETDEQIGPPYGLPVEFSHPAEEQPLPGPPLMSFTFLKGTKPARLNPRTARFYAWSSATRDGQVIAFDYAPDTGWITSGGS